MAKHLKNDDDKVRIALGITPKSQKDEIDNQAEKEAFAMSKIKGMTPYRAKGKRCARHGRKF